MKKILTLLFCILSFIVVFGQNGKRKLVPEDIYRFKNISNAKVSPEGKWVIYSIATADSSKDSRSTQLCMSSWDGKNTVQLTYGDDAVFNAQFSPEGKYISYLSSKKVDTLETSQLWLMDRRGGEGKSVTKIEGDIEEYCWSPDGTKILFQIKDVAPKPMGKAKTTAPYVINDYKFKTDVEGYLTGRKSHLYVFDILTHKLVQITKGNYDETDASWSPDCSSIVFVSNRTADGDRNSNTDIYLTEAKADAPIKQLTVWKGIDANPKFSPDGKNICYERSVSEENFINYDQSVLAIMNSDGKTSRLLTNTLDRPCTHADWSSDSKSVYFLVEDDRQVYISSVNVVSGAIKKVIDGDRSFLDVKYSVDGILTLMSDSYHTRNLYVLEKDKLRQITFLNDDFLKEINLAKVSGFKSIGKDSVEVSGLLTRSETKKMPLLLFIHGGPVGQDQYEFDMEAQLLASAGYAVAQVNYRGSNGKGVNFSKAIYGDWGNKEVIDLLGATDYLVKTGVADENKLGIGGWSYGGILTDYTIASDTRFKAAISGAGSAMQLSLYGVDMYMLQWNEEIGLPWEKPEVYTKLSYPFLKANKIKTPTLFMVGEKDFNVPAAGSEQMYAALKTLKIPTQLVVYPNQFHGLTTISYQIDRMNRFIKWYNQYLK